MYGILIPEKNYNTLPLNTVQYTPFYYIGTWGMTVFYSEPHFLRDVVMCISGAVCVCSTMLLIPAGGLCQTILAFMVIKAGAWLQIHGLSQTIHGLSKSRHRKRNVTALYLQSWQSGQVSEHHEAAEVSNLCRSGESTCPAWLSISLTSVPNCSKNSQSDR